MRVSVVGGTGLVGRQVVRALRERGHDPVVVARSTGADVTTGAGLADTLAGSDAVIDVTNTPATDAEAAVAFFGTATRNVLAAERDAGVRHHVVLSIVGVDKVPGNAHYAGKREQERLALAGPVPATVLRATQFFEFPDMVVGWTRDGDTAVLPPLLMQPVAVPDIADVLAEIATNEPRGGTVELAGPQTQDLVDMARRTLTARGESLRLVPSWRGPFGTQMAGEVLLPGPDARIAPTTFETWLASPAGLGSDDS
ncbi:MAG TPA: NAD(P)H-binding protein [Mycobacteriales bacterium]|nr:NAD(P)H-binding protein [Mycobacteriales bacterium]